MAHRGPQIIFVGVAVSKKPPLYSIIMWMQYLKLWLCAAVPTAAATNFYSLQFAHDSALSQYTQYTFMFQYYKSVNLVYLVQWQPVCFSPLDWAAAWCEWQEEAPASRFQIAGRWTEAERSLDTQGWPRSSHAPGFALADAIHSSRAGRRKRYDSIKCKTMAEVL